MPVIRLLLSFVVGAALGAGLLHASTGDDRFSWVWIAAMPVLVLGVVLMSVGRTMRSMAAPAPEAIDEARAAGRVCGAEVLDLTRTGMEINDVPQYEIELYVDARDRAPYRTVVRELVDASRMFERRPGTALTVARLGADVPDVAILSNESVPVRAGRRTDVPRWLPEPGVRVPGRRAPLVPVGRRGRPLRIVVYLLLASVGLGATTWQHRDDVALGVRSALTGSDATSYLAGEDRASDAVDAFVRESSHGTVTEVLVYDGYVRVTAPVRPGRAAYDDWLARATSADRQGPATIQPEPDDEFDVSDVDWGILPTLYDEAVERSGMSEDELDGNIQHIGVRRSLVEDGAPVRVMVRLSGDYGSYSLTADVECRVLDAG